MERGRGGELHSVGQVRDGEMVAVELVAQDTRGSVEVVLSLGCIQYDSTRYLHCTVPRVRGTV